MSCHVVLSVYIHSVSCHVILSLYSSSELLYIQFVYLFCCASGYFVVYLFSLWRFFVVYLFSLWRCFLLYICSLCVDGFSVVYLEFWSVLVFFLYICSICENVFLLYIWMFCMYLCFYCLSILFVVYVDVLFIQHEKHVLVLPCLLAAIDRKSVHCVFTCNSMICLCLQDANGSIGLLSDGMIRKSPVLILADVVVVKIVSGSDHLVCLSSLGELYTLGL